VGRTERGMMALGGVIGQSRGTGGAALGQNPVMVMQKSGQPSKKTGVHIPPPHK
jgi:hypothetical protein